MSDLFLAMFHLFIAQSDYNLNLRILCPSPSISSNGASVQPMPTYAHIDIKGKNE